MHRNAGQWKHCGGVSHFALPSGATRTEVPFHHRSSSRQFWGCDGFLPEIPQTCPKRFLCNFYLQIFSRKDHEDLSGVTSKKDLHVFLRKPWAPFFEVKQHWTPFYPDFQGFCLDFQQIKTFGGALSPFHPHLQYHCFL